MYDHFHPKNRIFKSSYYIIYIFMLFCTSSLFGQGGDTTYLQIEPGGSVHISRSWGYTLEVISAGIGIEVSALPYIQISDAQWSWANQLVTFNYTMTVSSDAPVGSLFFRVVYSTDFLGGTTQRTEYFYIVTDSSPLNAEFSASPTSGLHPLNVEFADQSTGHIIDWSWDFGDGGTSDLQNPAHTYQEPGIYTVQLTVTGIFGSNTEIEENYIEVSLNPDIPIAEFSGTPRIGMNPLTVHFTDESIGNVLSHLWDFGDGNTSDEENPSHTYLDPGLYTVQLTVTGSQGSDTIIKENYIDVELNPDIPVANFAAEPLTGHTPLSVEFTNQSTGIINEYLWDFGDGQTSTEENPSHTYEHRGEYTVSLEATGPLGSDQEIKIDYINAYTDLYARFYASPTSGIAPLAVEFIDDSDGEPAEYFWDFGDSHTSTEQNPVHVYDNAGVYSVSLTISYEEDNNTDINDDCVYVINEMEPSIGPHSWQDQNSGTSRNFYSVFFLNDDTGWGVGDNNIIVKTTNGGESWQVKDGGLADLNDPDLTSVFFIDEDNGWVSGLDRQNEDAGIILKTDDGGENWTYQIFQNAPDLRSIYFTNINKGFVVGDDNVNLKTTDGGENWTILDIEPDRTTFFQDVFFIDEDYGWVVGFNSMIYKTIDGGINWFRQNNYPNFGMFHLFSVHFVDRDHGWAVGEDGEIIKTENGGETWMVMYSGVTDWLKSVSFTDEYNGWAVTEHSLLKTHNGGATWEMLPEITSKYLESAFFADSYNAWLVGSDGAIIKGTGSLSSIEENLSAEYINPTKFLLSQNYPNPFNPETNIRFSLPNPEIVTINVYNTSGRNVKTIYNRQMRAGNHEIKFNAQNLSSGIYFYRIEAGEFQDVKKMILLR